MKKIKNAKNDEEIRAAFPIKCDAPYFIPCGADTETSYQDAVNAARAEYKAAEKLSALTARGYEGARRTDEWNRQREQARMSALWDLRRQPRRR